MNSLNLNKIILIGASTGGPGLIEKIITSLPLTISTPIVIAQHMDKLSLESFSKRLERIKGIKTSFVTSTMELKSGNIYILSDTSKLVSIRGNLCLEICCLEDSYYHPTVDILFKSASQLDDIMIRAYLLSGIGSDGAKGMMMLKDKGCKTIVQDEKTSIVYGMPKSAFELGASTDVCSIDEIIQDIKKEVLNVFTV